MIYLFHSYQNCQYTPEPPLAVVIGGSRGGRQLIAEAAAQHHQQEEEEEVAVQGAGRAGERGSSCSCC